MVTRTGILILFASLLPACNGTLDPNNSSTAPSFGGVTGASAGPSAGEVTLTWSPALELNGGTITYLVFAGIGTSGAENMSTPVTTTTSPTGVTVTGLTSSDPYAFIVQAQDSTGATDGNTVEAFATPP